MIPIIDSSHYLKSIIAIVLFSVITMAMHYFFGIVGVIVMICIGMAALICYVIHLVHEMNRIEQESKEE